MTSDGPVTSGALANINTSLLLVNGSMTFLPDPRLYHFHWEYSPLLLTHRSENDSSSSITVQCDTPGAYTVSVWVTERHCSQCEPVARSFTELQVTKDIVGQLTATQIQNNGTSLQSGIFLATNSTVRFYFLIHDPSHFFRSADFSYAWNFGDRTSLMTAEPFTNHSYSKPGNYSAVLQVTAHLHSQYEWHPRKKTGTFQATLILQDIIRNIIITGPSETTAKQNVSISLHFSGSPPLTVCWLIKADCVSLDGEECHPVVVNDTFYIINHTFQSAGSYCLSVKASNEVSMLVKHYDIDVESTGVHPLWFVLPCVTLLVLVLGIICFRLFRAPTKKTHPKALVEAANFDFSPESAKYEPFPEYKEIPERRKSTYCRNDRTVDDSEGGAETKPLLHSLSPSIRSYMM
ncbi:transmembrane protein 130 isoform X2 [Hyperolius riggenbachi]